MATDEPTAASGVEPVVADDLMAATEGNTVDTPDGPQVAEGTAVTPEVPEDTTVVDAPALVLGDDADPGDTTDTPPEQTTPAAGGDGVFVPSAAGDTSPPTPSDPDVADIPEIENEGPDDLPAPIAQAQQPQAPPMTDESGSNIPYPNLVQPIAGDMPEGPSHTVEQLDPALVNPEEIAKETHEGTVNDAALRAEGVGSGDVEVATTDPGTGEGEYYPALTLEDSVVLLEHELVPERLYGRRAFVLDAPRYLVPLDKLDEVWITVRTHDEVNATLTIPLAACTVERGGSPTVRG